MGLVAAHGNGGPVHESSPNSNCLQPSPRCFMAQDKHVYELYLLAQPQLPAQPPQPLAAFLPRFSASGGRISVHCLFIEILYYFYSLLLPMIHWSKLKPFLFILMFVGQISIGRHTSMFSACLHKQHIIFILYYCVLSMIHCSKLKPFLFVYDL